MVRRLQQLAVAAGCGGLAFAGATVVPVHAGSSADAVFVQTNDPGGNAIEVFDQVADGRLVAAGSFATGGLGGRESGAVVDPLASQGSVVLDRAAGLLLAVNAGSDSVSVFGVSGDVLSLRQVLPSGGEFPSSIALSGGLVYVLNAGGAGSVSGFTVSGGSLSPLSDSTRSLGLSNDNPPFFLSSPAQVSFTPSGGQLVVTTKGNGGVDVFSVDSAGLLSDAPVVNAIGGAPFAFDFDAAGRLALVNAGDNSLATYAVNPDGTLTLVGAPVTDGQTAACWIVSLGGFQFVANAGSGTLSQYSIAADGTVSLVNATAAAVPGAIDMATAGRILYAQSGGSSNVDAFKLSGGGSLRLVQQQQVSDGANQEGITAG